MASRFSTGMPHSCPRFSPAFRNTRIALTAFVLALMMVSWIPDLPLTNISHTVTLLVQDRAGNSTSTTWTFAVNGPPTAVLLTASPSAIVADGVSTATITATVTDRHGNPVSDGTEVVFTATLGTFSGSSACTTTARSGFAVAVLTASTTDGVARVTAGAGSAEGGTEVRFIRYRVYLPLVLRLGGLSR